MTVQEQNKALERRINAAFNEGKLDIIDESHPCERVGGLIYKEKSSPFSEYHFWNNWSVQNDNLATRHFRGGFTKSLSANQLLTTRGAK